MLFRSVRVCALRVRGGVDVGMNVCVCKFGFVFCFVFVFYCSFGYNNDVVTAVHKYRLVYPTETAIFLLMSFQGNTSVFFVIDDKSYHKALDKSL